MFYSLMSSDNHKVVLKLAGFVYFAMQRRQSVLKYIAVAPIGTGGGGGRGGGGVKHNKIKKKPTTYNFKEGLN